MILFSLTSLITSISISLKTKVPLLATILVIIRFESTFKENILLSTRNKYSVRIREIILIKLY
jgi:hypothetical protein